MQAQGARVVTPEAVVLDVQTAGLGSRAFARAIDALIQGALVAVVLVVVGVVAGASGGDFGTAGGVLVVAAFTVIVFGYPILWESLWRGRTPGKAALGLRVVTRQGAPIRFRHALVRGLIGLVEVTALPVVGVLAMLASPKDQRLGDLSAGTIVIRERAAERPSVPVVFYPPPGCESFVASLDVSAMTSGEYESARSFLLRAHQMAPLPRTNLAARLAGPLVARWHQPVPTGMGPELWLACAAAAYQLRQGSGAGADWGGLPTTAEPATWVPPAWGGPAGWGPPDPGRRVADIPPTAPPAPAGGWVPPAPPASPSPAPAASAGGWAPPAPPAPPASPASPPAAPAVPANNGFAPPD